MCEGSGKRRTAGLGRCVPSCYPFFKQELTKHGFEHVCCIIRIFIANRTSASDIYAFRFVGALDCVWFYGLCLTINRTVQFVRPKDRGIIHYLIENCMEDNVLKNAAQLLLTPYRIHWVMVSQHICHDLLHFSSHRKWKSQGHTLSTNCPVRVLTISIQELTMTESYTLRRCKYENLGYGQLHICMIDEHLWVGTFVHPIVMSWKGRKPGAFTFYSGQSIYSLNISFYENQSSICDETLILLTQKRKQ